MFSKGKIGKLKLRNRLVRSATWDPSLVKNRKMNSEILSHYKKLAMGGVGLIISGGLPAFEADFKTKPDNWLSNYFSIRVENIEKMPKIVHSSSPTCKIIAQIENGKINAYPSAYDSPYVNTKMRILTVSEIKSLVDCYVEAILDLKKAGFDGVQLHAAHGSLLSKFLSPFTNSRNDGYGGSHPKRVKVIKDIVSIARKSVGDFPILIKMNCTDNIPGGIDKNNFPDIATEIEKTGINALEISGGMWECLYRDEKELGFRPVPAPESRTRIQAIEKQSYYRNYTESLTIQIPVILTGGNRTVDLLEEILRRKNIDFIGLSRPLIREPDLPKRWLNSKGKSNPHCVSCNSCIYSMYKYPDRLVTCIQKNNTELHRKAQRWLRNWIQKNTI
jgi:2,4-dienoyl-CoA reductase-like NADH-dependent reductase (Old Yellow Enzyme family)